MFTLFTQGCGRINRLKCAFNFNNLLKYCKSRLFHMHVIFLYFVRGGFRAKQNACGRYKASHRIRSSHQISDCSKISCVQEVGEPRIRKMSAYELFWICSRTSNVFTVLKVCFETNINDFSVLLLFILIRFRRLDNNLLFDLPTTLFSGLSALRTL